MVTGKFVLGEEVHRVRICHLSKRLLTSPVHRWGSAVLTRLCPQHRHAASPFSSSADKPSHGLTAEQRLVLRALNVGAAVDYFVSLF